MGETSKEARAARAELLRGVLELAVGMARRDADGDPMALPPTLRPVVKMAKLGPRALATVDRAGADDAFRARIATLVGPDDLNPAETLWLERPAGWEESLDALVATEVATAEEGDVRRQLDREQRARRGAEAARDQAVEEARALRAEIDGWKARADKAAATLVEARERADAADAERAAAVRSLKELEAAHARAHEELRRLRDEASARAATGDDEPAAAPETGAGPPAECTIDREALTAAVARASEVAASLTSALSAVDALVAEDADGVEDAVPTAGGEEAAGGPLAAGPPEADPPARPIRRRPVRLPGGVHDDSPEGAAHLVRHPGAVLLVDGYNASKALWPRQPIADQRPRLVAALERLEARSGIDTTVVFDGIAQSLASARGAVRRVRIRFTEEGVEADDVILDLVDQIPGDRAVLVATDDRRVREGARDRGANLLTIDQLQSLLG